MRSWLLVAADADDALGSAAQAGADAVVLDLDRALPERRQSGARETAHDWLVAHQEQVLASKRFERWVRISPMSSQQWRADLHAIMRGKPDGIILPDTESPDSVQQLAAEIYEIEQACGVAHGATKIIPQLGSNPRAAMHIARFTDETHPRVSAFSWDAAALGRTIGARRTRTPSGWSSAMDVVRGQIILVAHARGLDVIETPYRNTKDLKACALIAQAARADGFTGMIATHPDQITHINEAFTPSPQEIHEAEEIVALFASNPTLEWQSFRGRRLSQPHLKRAKSLLGV